MFRLDAYLVFQLAWMRIQRLGGQRKHKYVTLPDFREYLVPPGLAAGELPIEPDLVAERCDVVGERFDDLAILVVVADEDPEHPPPRVFAEVVGARSFYRKRFSRASSAPDGGSALQILEPVEDDVDLSRQGRRQIAHRHHDESAAIRMDVEG